MSYASQQIRIVARRGREKDILEKPWLMQGQAVFDPQIGCLFFDLRGELHKTQGQYTIYQHKNVDYMIGQMSIAGSSNATLIKGDEAFYELQGLIYVMGQGHSVFVPNERCITEFIKNIPDPPDEEKPVSKIDGLKLALGLTKRMDDE